jgi:plastocyanin
MKNFFVLMAGALSICYGQFGMAQEHVVTQKNNQFSEVFLKLENNDKLKIVNLDSVNHRIAFMYKEKEQLVTELKPGASRIIELSSPGLYDIKSQNHPEMMMTIYVPHTIRIDGKKSEYYF